MLMDKKDNQQVMKNYLDDDNEPLAHEANDSEKKVHESSHESNSTFVQDEAGEVTPREIKDIALYGDCKCSTKKLSRQEKVELGRKLQEALSFRNWQLAESFITGTDLHTLNDALCMSLDSIWFLTTCQELDGLTALIKMIISNGASDFTRAALRTSFLASCVSACQSGSMSLADTVKFVSQRLHERLKECNGTDFLKKEASDKVLKFTEWAMKCIEVHQGNNDTGKQITLAEVQFQLSAFRTFLELADTQLTIRDFTEAFDAACFPLTLFSCSFDPGWASGTSAAAIRGLLNMLADRGADNVNQCVLEASRFGSTEVVRMLLQIARWNSLPVDVNLALGFAAYYCKFGTMECLVDEGEASAFLAPLMKAAERGCIPVVAWFVDRGCTDMELCLALTSAASAGQLAMANYLLPRVPNHVLSTFSAEILKTTAERGGGSLDGVAFLLSSDFLGSPDATYKVAESIVTGSDNGAVVPELMRFLRENWSMSAFAKGVKEAEDHYVNVMRVFRRGRSEIQLRELPTGLLVAIALLPLHRKCLKAGGRLLPQRLRGELVGVVRRLGYQDTGERSQRKELMAMLERQLPSFLGSDSD